MLRQTTPTRRPRRLRHVRAAVAAAALAGAAMGAFTGSASAADTTTAWYSIDQKPATSSSPAQFLTATSTGQVVLKAYSSGEMRQQWTPTYPEWPTSPTVTGSSVFNDFLDAFTSCITNWGCPFSGHAGGSPRKYVNRMYAMCLTFRATGSVTTQVVVSKCDGSGNATNRRQLFTWEFADKTIAKSGIPRTYTSIFGTRADGQGRCLDSAGGSSQPGINAAATTCGSASPLGTAAWSQGFRFLQSGSATCRRNYPGTLCGLGAPVQ